MNPVKPKYHDLWSKDEKKAIKRYILLFGYGRWSKMRSFSKHNDRSLFKKSDDELRAYANVFLIHLCSCLNQDDSTLDLMEKIV